MSLNWDCSKVKDYEALHASEWEGIVTQACVFACIGIGLRGITEANAAEFYARVKLAERLTGPYVVTKGGEPYLLTVEDVQRRIGLSTNVSAETRPQWLKRYVGYDLDDSVRVFTWKTQKQPVASS